MAKKEVNFIMATHLHILPTLECIKEIKNLGIYHLKITKKGDKIIYDRTLTAGPGDSLYGLEIASLFLPKEFMEEAFKIRKIILNDNGPLGKSSSYNCEMFLDKCGICGMVAEEIHHIRFQQDADENGFIGHFHKNHLRNLVGLCEKCHKNLHLGKIVINGWLETSDGFVLDWK